jgi:hypothetical protein
MQVAKWLRGALVGVALIAGPPAFAQAPGLFTGDDDYDDFFDFPGFCVEITDRQVRNAVSAQGFTNIYLNARHDRAVQVRATRDRTVYLLQVSTCTGSILYGQPLRPS